MSTSLPFVPGRWGIDEAGRGPLAGPVVAAGVALPAGFEAAGLRDSKKLTSSQRELQYERLIHSVPCQIVVVPPDEIDRINILRATLQAMSRILVDSQVQEAVIDGNTLPAAPQCAMTALVKGDDKDAAIAAASILAKVTRDRLMTLAHAEFPMYGFSHNFGYGSPDHLEALRVHGPCPLHRRSFEPIRSMLNQPCLTLFD